MHSTAHSVAISLMHVSFYSGTFTQIAAILKTSWRTIVPCGNDDIIFYNDRTIFSLYARASVRKNFCAIQICINLGDSFSFFWLNHNGTSPQIQVTSAFILPPITLKINCLL